MTILGRRIIVWRILVGLLLIAANAQNGLSDRFGFIPLYGGANMAFSLGRNAAILAVYVLGFWLLWTGIRQPNSN